MRKLRCLAFCLAFAVLAACTRGPDAAGLERDVQAKVDALFGRQMLAVVSLRRQGSAPYRAAADGSRQVIVYYNATFHLTEAYDPSDWQGLNPTVIANAMGASDEGVSGLKSGVNDAGTQLRAYGSVIYRKYDQGWRPADVMVPGPAVAAYQGEPQSRAEELMRRLAALVQETPARQGKDDEIIAEEIDRALANIRLRLDRSGARIVVASGPEGGEYARFIDSLRARARDRDVISAAMTAGSVENALMIEKGEARAGLVQSDVAAAAVTGDGAFAGTGPLGHIRGVASLFPESVHVVVRADSNIRSLRDLAGRRVVLGQAASGTRQTALRLVDAAGEAASRVVEVEDVIPQAALTELAAGRVDAVIEVISAPWRQLEVAMRSSRLRLLPLDQQTIGRVVENVHGLVLLVIPAHTYPGQEADIPTVAATALLVARDDVPDAVVRDALDLMYASAASGDAGVRATRLSRERATIGMTIPMHKAAEVYFGTRATAPTSSGSTAREASAAGVADQHR